MTLRVLLVICLLELAGIGWLFTSAELRAYRWEQQARHFMEICGAEPSR